MGNANGKLRKGEIAEKNAKASPASNTLRQFHRRLRLPTAAATRTAAAAAATTTSAAARTPTAATSAAAATSTSATTASAAAGTARASAALPGTTALTATTAAGTTRRAAAHGAGGTVIRLLVRGPEGIQRGHDHESQHYDQKSVFGSVLAHFLLPEPLERGQHGTTIISAGGTAIQLCIKSQGILYNISTEISRVNYLPGAFDRDCHG